MDTVVKAAMRRFDGNKTKAADYLGISRFALHRRLQQMGENEGGEDHPRKDAKTSN